MRTDVLGRHEEMSGVLVSKPASKGGGRSAGVVDHSRAGPVYRPRSEVDFSARIARVSGRYVSVLVINGRQAVHSRLCRSTNERIQSQF